MLGENLRKALSDARIPHQEAADKMGISKGSLYNLFKKDSFEVDYLRRASEITGLSISDFFDYKSEMLDNVSKEEKSFGGQTISRMSKNIEELRAMFEEEIRIKNQQIAGLQRTVDVLVGKSEGVTVEPLSTSLSEFNALFNSYRLSTGYGELLNPKPTNNDGGKVGGTPFSHVENALTIR